MVNFLKGKKGSYMIYVLIFFILLICNNNTYMLADDFAYSFSFATGERIRNFLEIFPSMSAHAESMNGRLVPHFIVQCFLMLPKWIFNIINTGIFVLLVYLIYKISLIDLKKMNNILLLMIFAGLWIYTPAFGQIYLWLDGSCNYLWGYVLGFIFILPYVNSFLTDKIIENRLYQFLFFIFAFLAGAYSENASPAYICIGVLLLLFNIVIFKNKLKIYEVVGIFCSCIGYMTIYFSPAQWMNKSTKLTLGTLRENFIIALDKYKELAIVLVAFVMLLVIGVSIKIEIKRILLSVVLFVGSLLSNFIMIVASYYPDRSLACSAVLLLSAISILIPVLYKEIAYKILIQCAAAILLIMNFYNLCIGMNDIYCTGSKIRYNVELIYQNKQQGIYNITVPLFVADTKYSAVNGIRYLSDETAETWPNDSMAKYYQINQIIGKWE